MNKALYLLIVVSPGIYSILSLPVKTTQKLELTSIGQYGVTRKERPTVKAHLHTGVDIKRPGTKYDDEPIFPIANGKVISKRDDGPFSQLIIEHQVNGLRFWTLYEHIMGITVKLNDPVEPKKPLARFMNRAELNRYGWQFDHFHFEVIRDQPISLKPDSRYPERLFNSFTLTCYTQQELEKHYYDPLEFLTQGPK